MNLIEEDIEQIKVCLFALPETILEEAKKLFWDAESGEKTAWKDYEQCRHMSQGIIPYDFTVPNEFVKYLETLWKVEDSAFRNLISALTVGIFRQKRSERKEP